MVVGVKMREILFKGKRKDNGEWIEGSSINTQYDVSGKKHVYIGIPVISEMYPLMQTIEWIEVIPETLGQYTGLTDKNGKKIFEGDIVQYQNFMEFDIQSVVKFGEYKQDGSDGEYGGENCLGFYVEVDNFTCPDWCDNQPEYFRDHWETENLLQVNDSCEVIGNIHDNPELLKREAENA